MANRRKILILLLFLIPPVWIATLVGRYGITVPFWDAWELVPLLERVQSGNLAFSDLWAPHGDHRIFFPEVIMLALAQLSAWNITWELIINFMLVSLTLLVFCHLLRQTVDSSWPWVSILFSCFIFSPVQWENFSWGWQLQIFLSNLAMGVAVWSVTQWPGRWRGICLAIGAALIASYSFANGPVTWVAVLFLIVQRERNWKHAVLVGLAFTAAIVFYTLGYKGAYFQSKFLFLITHPFDFIGYVLIYLGSPMGFGREDVSLMIGLLALALAFAGTIGARRFSQKEFHKTLPWQAVALYSLLSALATAVGRAEFGVEQALSSRYTTLATPFLVSALVITILWLRDPMGNGSPLPVRWKKLIGGLSALLAFCFVLSFSKGERGFVAQRDRLQWALVYLKHPDLAPDEFLKVFYPHAEIIRERAKALLQMGFLKRIDREKSGKTDPYQAVAYSDMAGRYLAENRLEEAMYSLRTALEIDPACAEAHYNLGMLYYNQHRLEESLAALQRSSEIKPGYFAPHYWLGLIFLSKNMLKESEGEFKKALDLNPSYDNTLFNLGVVCARQGRLNEAEELWLRTLKLNPEHTIAQINLAIAYYNRRDFTRAKIHFMNLRKKGMSIDTRILRELDIP